MISRLIARLDADIMMANDSVTADALRAEQACHFARAGNREEVKNILLELHNKYDRAPHPTISVWLHLVEGLDIFYSDMGLQAIDKLQRAHAVSRGYKLRSLQARSSAWMGHWFYGMQQFKKMASSTVEALTVARSSEHSTLSRACLVVAQAMHLADGDNIASIWYSRAREHAIADGDEITTSAILHNRASIGIGRIRNATLQGMGTTQAPDSSLAGGESAKNFDVLVGATNLSSFTPLLRAQGLVMKGDIDGALALYKDNIERSKTQGLGRLQAWLLADVAWCYASKGQEALARAYHLQSLSAFNESDHVDDRAAAYTRLAQVSEIVGDDAGVDIYRQEAATNWAKFSEMHMEIRKCLENINELYDDLMSGKGS